MISSYTQVSQYLTGPENWHRYLGSRQEKDTRTAISLVVRLKHHCGDASP
jgi:hypothetical protein